MGTDDVPMGYYDFQPGWYSGMDLFWDTLAWMIQQFL